MQYDIDLSAYKEAPHLSNAITKLNVHPQTQKNKSKAHRKVILRIEHPIRNYRIKLYITFYCCFHFCWAASEHIQTTRKGTSRSVAYI
jgi:hypothetical protein